MIFSERKTKYIVILIKA